MCEMYGRPAYIWAYDAQRGIYYYDAVNVSESYSFDIFCAGAKNLRTFHEAAEVYCRGGGQSGGEIRLSYYGGGHYDSIHKVGAFDQDRGFSSGNSGQEKVGGTAPWQS